MSEYATRRLHSARVKAEQLQATGARIVATSCHNCVDGLFDLIKHYKLDMQVKLLVNLVANAMVPEKAAAKAPAAAGKRAKPLAGKRVLVVDDEADIRLYLRMIFKDQGAEVVEAPDANQAMRAIVSATPDLMTLDLIMPHKTGEKLYWELRKDPKYAELPVMIITGYAKVEPQTIDFQKFIAERNIPEPNAFLEKPIQPDLVLETALRILAKQE